MKAVSYRAGRPDDLMQLKELGIASYGQYARVLATNHWENLNRFLHDEKALLDLIVQSHPFVCECNKVIVGMAYLIPSGNPTDIFQHDWSYIRMVGVHPGHTGQGIARRLTEMCIDKAKDLKEKTIALHTSEFMDAARHLYESIGFTVLKEIPQRLGKRYWLYTIDIS